MVRLAPVALLLTLALAAGGAAAQSGPVLIEPIVPGETATPEAIRDWFGERAQNLALRLRDTTGTRGPCDAAVPIPTPFGPGGVAPVPMPDMEVDGPPPAPMPNLCAGGAAQHGVPTPPGLRPQGQPRLLFRLPMDSPAAPPPDER